MIVNEFDVERGMVYYKLYYMEERRFNCNEMLLSNNHINSHSETPEWLFM